MKHDNRNDVVTESEGQFDAVVGAPPIDYNEIYLGDSFELCERVEAKTVDLILEDMPYNTTACEWDVKIDLQFYWETRLRLLKPTGVIVLTASQPFTTDLINSNRKMFKYEWIWAKTRPANFMNAGYQPMKYHENILIFNNIHTFNPIKKKGEKNHASKPRKGSSNIYGLASNEAGIDINDMKSPSTILEIKSTDSTQNIHPTQKPVGLFEYLIRTYTNEGDLVFDGFGGSGTTAIAAYKAKRNFIVIEKEQKYYELAKKRLENERAQTRLF